MSGIKVSPKHGLNPTIPVCFFCGKEKNEVALLGKYNKEDDEAPRSCIINYEPCDECKAQMDRGITLITVSDKQYNNLPPFQKDESTGVELYPTGPWMVITEDAAMRYFNIDKDDEIIKKRICLVYN